jgi:hypothetical protein
MAIDGLDHCRKLFNSFNLYCRNRISFPRVSSGTRFTPFIDIGGGWGAEAIGALERNGIPVAPYRGLAPSIATSREGGLKFCNRRAEDWWRMREELDPEREFGSAMALPPDASIKADLAAPHWEMTARGIKIEDKDEIRKRLGRSPDDGDAIVMCLGEGARAARRLVRERRRGPRPERANVGYSELKERFRG